MHTIGIIGGGNIGVALAVELAGNNKKAILYTSNSTIWKNPIDLYEDDLIKYSSCIIDVTSDLQELCEKCNIIVVTYPPHLFKKINNMLEQHLRPNTKIIVVPGTGGAEYVFRHLIDKGCILIGLQRVPAVYRILEKGKSASIRGRKKGLYVCSIPKMKDAALINCIAEVFNMSCTIVPNYLNITLTPSNPILHTSRIYSLFSNYGPEDTFIKNPLFYGEWSVDSSEILFQCDDELFKIINEIPLDLSFVESLKIHYKSNTTMELTNMIKSIKPLSKIYSPMLGNNCFHIDWDSRYFKSDFPNGLMIIKSIALLTMTETPMIDKILFWYQDMVHKTYLLDDKTFGKDIIECNIPQNYGITNLEELCAIYWS